ncbi:hypothetical protein HID58_069761 [Brassica napus]|uniref:Uncharacterized protein n=1 Tax=Brassica napus TaxID=3708 RepID=A0ABQ7YWT6_BRANA|nr:hypothetical protein HID58_069761 [Brassica napus]
MLGLNHFIVISTKHSKSKHQPRIHERSRIRGIFLSHEIVNQKSEQYLIQLARDGLKEDIREGLESTEFATLGALFQEASEVEEILEMEKSPPTSPRRRKRKTMRLGDPEDEHPWDNPEEEDEEESEEEEEEEEDTDDWSYEGDIIFDVSDDDMIDEETDEYIHHGDRGPLSGVPGPLTAYNAKSGCGSVAKSSAAEQVSVCGSNVMAGGGSVSDSSSVSGSNSAQGSSAAQGSVYRRFVFLICFLLLSSWRTYFGMIH